MPQQSFEHLRHGDWSDPASRLVNEHGSKAQIGQAKSPYSIWRRTVGHGCYANDVDWIEWRSGEDGATRFVAVIETTFYEDKPEWRHLLPRYRQQALNRFKRDAQYRADLAVFHVCRLEDEQWREMLEPGYRRWLLSLGGESK
jgi:hypothetical protein